MAPAALFYEYDFIVENFALLGNAMEVTNYPLLRKSIWHAFWNHSCRHSKLLDEREHPAENYAGIIAGVLTIPAPRCQHLETYHQYFIIVTQILIGLMLVLRTYALYGRSKRVLALMIFVAVASIAVAILSVFTGKGGDCSQNLRLNVGCAYGFTEAQVSSMEPLFRVVSERDNFRRGISLATASAGSGVLDFMVFILTLRKGLGLDSRGVNFLGVLLRDGSVYFGPPSRALISSPLIQVTKLGSPYTCGIITTFTNMYIVKE
ncbi:hypothetical protein B0H14DRAFT_3611821 [Mycena olivaceomarginata]|nr:hypothetical protein B0H14DRAFT_3611821 [Mycena olivaceomarginata]